MTMASSSRGQERQKVMYASSVRRAGAEMTNDDNDVVVIVTERFERRLGEESGQLRVAMATELGKVRVEMATEFGKVRAEMATEFGKVRAEMATELGKVRAEMADGFGRLRAEMIDRNADLLKWGLVFGITQTAAIAGIVALLR
jgi:hypothetical protein